MKRIVSITLTLFVLSNFAKAQTTWEDYRYVTKGLKDDLSMGKAVKAGYGTEILGTEAWVTQAGIQRNAQLYYFKHSNETKAFVVSCWDSRNNYSYFCIPTSDAGSDIWTKCFQDINSAGQE